MVYFFANTGETRGSPGITCFQIDDDRFPTWHYPPDLTHVLFFCEATLRYSVRRFRWRCESPLKDVALMQKGYTIKVMHKEMEVAE